MTRVYAEKAEKEPAYLPQMKALVNRQSRGVAGKATVASGAGFHSPFG
jgi:hypothetical protein